MQSFIISDLSTLKVVQYVHIDMSRLQLESSPLVSLIMNLYYIVIQISQMTHNIYYYFYFIISILLFIVGYLKLCSLFISIPVSFNILSIYLCLNQKSKIMSSISYQLSIIIDKIFS